MADTYTVEEILGQREWAPADDPSKKTIYFEFKAKDIAPVCSIGRKPDNPLKVGDSFEAEVKSEKNGKLNLKRVAAFGGGGGGGKSFDADPKKIRREAMGSALHAAVQYVVAANQAGAEEKSQYVDKLALRWYGLIMDAVEGIPDAQRKSEGGL